VGLGVLGAVGLTSWLVVVPYLRARAAIEANIEAATVDHRPGLVLGLADPDGTVADLGGPEEAAWAMKVYLNAPDRIAPEKVTALFVLAACGEENLPLIARSMESGEPQVRGAAGYALGQIRGAEARTIPLLARKLDTEKDLDALILIGMGLDRMCQNNPAAVEPLAKVLASRRYGRARACAVPALGKTGTPRAMAHLQAALKDRDPQIRLAAEYVVGKLKAPPQHD
jgi:hypothetical protein